MMNENVTVIKTTLIGVLAVVNSIVESKFGSLSLLLYIVMAAMIADLVTRIYAAGSPKNPEEKVESKKVWQGVYRKVGLLLAIVLGLILDAGILQIVSIVGVSIVPKIIFTALILAWIFIREIVSILENLQLAGIDLPPFIANSLKIGQGKIEDIGNELIKGGGDV